MTRMPVILHACDYDRWLERSEVHAPPRDLLRPYEAGEMRVAACNSRVGDPLPIMDARLATNDTTVR